MSTLDALRQKAVKLADQLRDAETQAATATKARHDRNVARRAEFWADATQRVADAGKSATQARAQVQAHIAAGEGSRALDAYLAYRQRHAELDLVNGAAAGSTEYYADETGRNLGLVAQYHREHASTPGGHYRIVHPTGVRHRVDEPTSWDTLLTEGATALAKSHRAAYAAAYVADLTADLEPEDDQ